MFDTNLIYSRVIGLQASSRDVNIPRLLSHELARVLISMFADSGDIRIFTAKSALKKLRGDSICNEIALITPRTHGLTLYTIYGMKEQGVTFRMVWRIRLYSIILTYLVTDFEKGALIYTVYIFIHIEKKYFNKVRKVRCTF